MKKILLALALCFFGFISMNAQDSKFPSLDKSPMDAVHYPRSSAFNNYMDEDEKLDRKIKVLYCRPVVKGRKIFGELVPYGKEWRLGANEATEVTFFDAVEIGGTFVNRGNYTMFADVNEKEWTIKFSTQRHLGGNKDRDMSKDVASMTIPVKTVGESRESFTIGFQKINDGLVHMIFAWDKVEAALPINLNPASLAGKDASPMDLVQYPNKSRYRNSLKPEELDAAVAKVRVVYSRPQLKGRKVFGEMLKYGEMWRVGANETTEITFFEDVTIDGKKVKKGKYGLFAKVNADSWEFILHTNLPSWGSENHDPKTNVLTFTAKTEKTPSKVEALSILLVENGANKIDLVVGWENTMARLPIMLK